MALDQSRIQGFGNDGQEEKQESSFWGSTFIQDFSSFFSGQAAEDDDADEGGCLGPHAVTDRQREEATELVTSFCAHFPAARVAPKPQELEDLWVQVTNVPPRAVVGAIYEQISFADGETDWRPRLRVLYILEYFYGKGELGQEITMGVWQQASGLLEHLSTEVLQCREKAAQVLLLLSAKATPVTAEAPASDTTAGSSSEASEAPKHYPATASETRRHYPAASGPSEALRHYQAAAKAAGHCSAASEASEVSAAATTSELLVARQVLLRREGEKTSTNGVVPAKMADPPLDLLDFSDPISPTERLGGQSSSSTATPVTSTPSRDLLCQSPRFPVQPISPPVTAKTSSASIANDAFDPNKNAVLTLQAPATSDGLCASSLTSSDFAAFGGSSSSASTWPASAATAKATAPVGGGYTAQAQAPLIDPSLFPPSLTSAPAATRTANTGVPVLSPPRQVAATPAAGAQYLGAADWQSAVDEPTRPADPFASLSNFTGI